MTTFSETNRIGDVLKFEAHQNFNREVVTMISGQDLVAGTVLGKITASGKYTLHNNAGGDGSEVAIAVLLFDCDASGGDTPAVILARGPAIVSNDDLVFKSGISAPNRAAAITNLASLGIVARATV